MAIEAIPKPKITTVLWSKIINFLFYLSFFLLLIFLLSYFILTFFEKKYNQELAELTKILEATPLEKKKKELAVYQRKIDDFGILLAEHKFPSKVLTFLEKTCHPKVQFTEFSLNTREGKVSLSGLAESFQVLEQQMGIFSEEELLKEVNLSEISLGQEGKIGFNLQLTFQPQIFQP
jgi:Tfp pilus assembly protein PilN